MSGPPPLPPRVPVPAEPALPAAPPPPAPVRAETIWEFHADERIVEAGFGSDGLPRLVDALGTFIMLGMNGQPALSTRLATPVRAAAVTPAGGAVILTDAGLLVGLDEAGHQRWETKADGARCVGASARCIVVAGGRAPLRTLTPAGRPRSECKVEHDVAFVAPCSPHGHVVALDSSGHFSVVQGSTLLWKFHLRTNAAALGACDGGMFVVAHRDGAQVFSIEGWSLALYDVGAPMIGASLSPDGSTLLLLDDTSTMHLVQRESGFSTWRERRPRRQALVRLSRDGSRALAVSTAGAVELLAFERGADRAGRLEVLAHGVPTGDATWRYPTATLEDVEPSARVAVDPLGTMVAVSRDEGHVVEVRDAQGASVARVPGLRDLLALAFSTDGSVLVLHGRNRVVVVGRDGRPRAEIHGAFTHVVPGPGEALIAASGNPTPRLVVHRAGTDVDVALRGPAIQVLATPDLRVIVATDERGTLRVLDGAGGRSWQRAHDARAGSVALGGPGLVVAEGNELVGLALDGSEAWRVAAPTRLELFPLRGHVFGREGGNRFCHVAADGAIAAVDARPNLGRSRLVEAPSSDGSGLLELNLNGRVLTAFHLDGRIAWRTEAPDVIAPTGLLACGGLIAYRAGTRLCLLGQPGAVGAGDVAGRAAFLEL